MGLCSGDALLEEALQSVGFHCSDLAVLLEQVSACGSNASVGLSASGRCLPRAGWGVLVTGGCAAKGVSWAMSNPCS